MDTNKCVWCSVSLYFRLQICILLISMERLIHILSLSWANQKSRTKRTTSPNSSILYSASKLRERYSSFSFSLSFKYIWAWICCSPHIRFNFFFLFCFSSTCQIIRHRGHLPHGVHAVGVGVRLGSCRHWWPDRRDKDWLGESFLQQIQSHLRHFLQILCVSIHVFYPFHVLFIVKVSLYSMKPDAYLNRFYFVINVNTLNLIDSHYMLCRHLKSSLSMLLYLKFSEM